MKTTSIKKIINHKFFLYGMIFLSVLQFLNFYKSNSLSCLGSFGIVYYISCIYTKNKALCLLIAVFVSTFILGCSKTIEGFQEGVETAAAKTEETEVDPTAGAVVDPKPLAPQTETDPTENEKEAVEDAMATAIASTG